MGNKGKQAKTKGGNPLAIAPKKFEADLMSWLEAERERILSNPNADGWIRLVELLREAKKDTRVMSSPGAHDFLELILDLAEDAFTAGSADVAILPLQELIISNVGSDNANKRFAKTRTAEQWVVSEWEKFKGEYSGNKSDFARAYSRRLLKECDISVTDRTIRERWLKGCR